MDDKVLRGFSFTRQARPLLGLALIGLLILSGCVFPSAEKMNETYHKKKSFCESKNGIYIETLHSETCYIKDNDYWQTYEVIIINGVVGFEQ